MTRFRGVLSTQPGSVPYADFELTQEPLQNQRKEQLGPYGDGTEIPIFVQQPFEVIFIILTNNLIFFLDFLITHIFNEELRHALHSHGRHGHPNWHVHLCHGRLAVDIRIARFWGVAANGTEAEATDFDRA